MAVRERVEIVITEKGARGTSNSIKGVGRTSRTAAKAVAALAAGLAIIGGAAGFIRVTKNAIGASAAFEQYGLRIGALLGSQTEANKALDNFVTLAAKTPFAVSEIVEGASTLGAAALGNRERLEELTQTAANLAAVTGLSFREAAGNLQRSLQAGIGAADLFRERGVRALIESIAGIPDATKATADELDAAFKTVFGEGGVFGTAAEQLSTTLGGALSNIGDAATNLNVALGDAFAPAVINTARQVIIPFLTQLQGQVVANEDALLRFAAGAVRDTLEGLLRMAQAGLAVIQAFDQIGDTVSSVGRNIAGGFLEATLALAEATLATQQFVGASDDAIASTERSIAGLNESIDGFAASERQAGVDAIAFEKNLDAINDKIVELQTTLRGTNLANDPRTDAPDINLPTGGAAEGTSAAAIKSQETAAARLLAITLRLRATEASRIEPLQGALEKLRQTEATVIATANAANDLEGSSEALGIIADQRSAIEKEIAFETERQARLQAEIVTLIAQAAAISPILAAEIRAAADEAVRAGGGLEKVNNELERVGTAATRGLKDAREDANEFGNTIQSELERGIGTAVRSSLAGEGIDAAGIFADAAGTLLSEQFNKALESLTSGLEGALGGAFGGNLGGLIGAGLTAATTVLAGALKETSSTISNNLIRSAASQSSAAASRGVIAGPTSIPIFQVGAQLEAALGATNAILEDILEAIQAGPGLAAFGGAGDASATALETTTGSLT